MSDAGYITIEAAAFGTKRSHHTIRTWVSRGLVPSKRQRFTGRVLVLAAAVLEQHQRAGRRAHVRMS